MLRVCVVCLLALPIFECERAVALQLLDMINIFLGGCQMGTFFFQNMHTGGFSNS